MLFNIYFKNYIYEKYKTMSVMKKKIIDRHYTSLKEELEQL